MNVEHKEVDFEECFSAAREVATQAGKVIIDDILFRF